MPAIALRNIPTSSRDKAKASDFAGEDKSFPILEPKDVSAAAKSIGRAGADNYSSDQLKANIIKIAKRKGAAFVAQLPKAWTADSTDASLTPFVGLIALGEAVEGQARTSWAQVLRTGDFYDPRYGDFSITAKDLSTMVENFKTGKYPVSPTKLSVDYNHGTSRPSSAEEGKAAGWVLDLELRERGQQLWAHVEWTAEGAERIEKKEYQFTSGTFSFDYTNSNGGDDIGPTLQAFAICNRPVVHGMEPLALALAHPGAARITLAETSADDEMAEALFSFDEQRRRVQAALTAAFGTPYGYATIDGYAPFRGVYLVDLFDDYAVFSEYDGGKFRVDYALAADGAITFTSEPTEVRVSYEPLTAPDAEEQTMSTMKIKNAAGQEIELSQDQIDAVVKAHAPKPTGDVELVALKQTLETQGGQIVELRTKNEALELAAKTEKATASVDALVRAGKLDPKDRAAWLALALADATQFAALSATLAVKRAIDTRTGSDADGDVASAATSQLEAAIAAIKTAEPTLTRQQAYALALERNPNLYELVSRA